MGVGSEVTPDPPYPMDFFKTPPITPIKTDAPHGAPPPPPSLTSQIFMLLKNSFLAVVIAYVPFLF